jgi:hypothetical protein
METEADRETNRYFCRKKLKIAFAENGVKISAR